MSHTCAAERCSVVIADDKFMCLDQWRLVPSRIQNAINTGWRAQRRARVLQQRLAIIRNYRSACDEAVEAVRKMGPLA